MPKTTYNSFTFEEYSERARTTANYEELEYGWLYPLIGLCGETGELANKLKKVIRDKTFDEVKVKHELGDILWYLNQLCLELDMSLSDVARENLRKLEARYKNNTIHGDGDER